MVAWAHGDVFGCFWGFLGFFGLIKFGSISSPWSICGINPQRCVKYPVIMTSSLYFIHMRREVETPGNILESLYVNACTMIEKTFLSM